MAYKRKTRDYQLAFLNGETGEFDVYDVFRARDDDAANAYAAKHYPPEKHNGEEWYVLDSSGDNING